ncbi:hypothetical protein ACH4C6_36505, partial [Streptomyces sp. NPDC017943]|uniref:hypothetical protein n=1 Tax=Streptomyces sp. NPDC017943 TaxID=3365019 RepID=UPI003791CF27
MMVTMPISPKHPTELAPRAQNEPWLREEGQLKRIVGQVQTLIQRRRELLELRMNWSDIPPESGREGHLRRLDMQKEHADRQQLMSNMSDDLCKLGYYLWRRQLNLIAQYETIPMVSSLGYLPPEGL